jgi:surface carbohydrate biosynthesis protein
MTQSASTLLIPVESQVRELDAKLLLSCVAVERGYPVVLGSRAFLHHGVASVPRGVYLAKSMRSKSDRMFDILRKLGHEIVAFEEEALVRLTDEHYYQQRLSAKAVGMVSHLLAWGLDDAEVLSAYWGNPGVPVHVTGNPRMDMLRPELRDYFRPAADRIRDRLGDFVLINTNFGPLNHFFHNLSEPRPLADGEGLGSEDDYLKGRALFRLAIFQHFQEMVPSLVASLPEINFVVRPHPSESHELWRKLTAGFENAEVANEDSVIPWLLAAKATVANGCTTSVEARVLGTPAIAYQPVTSEIYDDVLPQAMCHRCFDLESLNETIRDSVSGKLGVRDDRETREQLARHLSALEGDLSVDRVVDVLDGAGYREAQPPAASWTHFAQGWIHTHIRTAVKQLNMRRPGHRNHLAYHAHRFPEITAAQLQERVDRLSGLTGRFADIVVEPHSRHLFRLGTGRTG